MAPDSDIQPDTFAAHPSQPWLTVVGIGEDGLDGLGEAARELIANARVLIGGARHLALLPERPHQRRQPWPSPFSAAYALIEHERAHAPVVLASGDPMCYGIGASLARRFGADALHVLPAPSALSLAAARLGWPLQETVIVAAHGRPLAKVNRHLAPGARLLVLAADGTTPARLAAQLRERGYGASRLRVLEYLGGPRERQRSERASDWPEVDCAALNIVAIDCKADPGTPALPCCALPDDAFAHAGQITKRDVRAATLARLAPGLEELLWDVGAGSGSIAIEWLRAGTRCRAIAIEPNPARGELIRRNRETLGVPELELVTGRAPAALDGLPTPDAIFIGGGLTTPGLFEACWTALRIGGRLIANAVTLEGEAILTGLYGHFGGTLTRVAIDHAEPLGGFSGWRSARPVTILHTVKMPDTAAGNRCAIGP